MKKINSIKTKSTPKSKPFGVRFNLKFLTKLEDLAAIQGISTNKLILKMVRAQFHNETKLAYEISEAKKKYKLLSEVLA